jgi:hypothetical protein
VVKELLERAIPKAGQIKKRSEGELPWSEPRSIRSGIWSRRRNEAKLSTRFWFPFEPNRWLSNEKLSLVSLEAKGLWIHLVCLIYKANAGGRLVINGNPPTPEQISRMVGQDASPLLQELEVAGVYEIKDGAIFHGGTAATLADMNKRSAGYASRITHRCS